MPPNKPPSVIPQKTYTSDCRPRLTIDITQHQYDALSRILPHGWRRPLFEALIDGVIALHARGGAEAIALIIGRQIDAESITTLRKENGNPTQP